MQKILVGLCVKKLTFSMLRSLKLNFSTTVFGTNYFRIIVFRTDGRNNWKIVNFTYSCLYATPIKVVSVDNIIRNNHIYYCSKKCSFHSEILPFWNITEIFWKYSEILPFIILPCNSWKKEECPLEGKCRANDIIYKCIASASGFPNKVYLGTAQGEFKKRFHNHN